MPRPLDIIPHLMDGLWLTILIALGGSGLALVCALLAGLGRRSHDRIVRCFSAIYVETFRGTSAIVQLFWFYYAVPILLGIRLNAVLVGILVLGLNVGAYGAEVVRAAIEAVPLGQRQAAVALSFSRWQTMRYVILPQAALMMLPPFGNLLIELLKSTTLVYFIGVTDLLMAGVFYRDDTHRNVETYSVLLLIYFGMSMLITAGIRWLERRLSYGQQHGGAA